MTYDNPKDLPAEDTLLGSRPNIAVAFDEDFRHSAEVYKGVSDYAQQHCDWNLIPLNYGFEHVLENLVKSSRIDGLIAGFISDAWLAHLPKTGVKMVNVSGLSEIVSIPTVTVDDEAIGHMAAAALLESDLKAYAFCGIAGRHDSRVRERAFREKVESLQASVAEAPRSGATNRKGWLEALPRPAGVFCANDHVARKLILECRALNLRVPEDISVVGVGDSLVESILAGVAVSSIELPSRAIGSAAAARLSLLLSDGPATEPVRKLAPLRLRHRQSSRSRRHSEQVEKALAFIRDNLPRPITVDDMAHVAGLSRRLLETRFQAEVGRAPYAELQHQRMELAKSLLHHSDLKIAEISSRCGYPEQHRFSHAFKREAGKSPKAYRENT